MLVLVFNMSRSHLQHQGSSTILVGDTDIVYIVQSILCGMQIGRLGLRNSRNENDEVSAVGGVLARSSHGTHLSPVSHTSKILQTRSHTGFIFGSPLDICISQPCCS